MKKEEGSEVMNFLCAEYDYEMDMQVKKEKPTKKDSAMDLIMVF